MPRERLAGVVEALGVSDCDQIDCLMRRAAIGRLLIPRAQIRVHMKTAFFFTCLPHFISFVATFLSIPKVVIKPHDLPRIPTSDSAKGSIDISCDWLSLDGHR